MCCVPRLTRLVGVLKLPSGLETSSFEVEFVATHKESRAGKTISHWHRVGAADCGTYHLLEIE